ncbi:fimbrial protein [Burkholderia latens]|uniref:fimbrial protein n=1 Tax=Burkholderia latens TaxID=488446 RepID=UPI00158AB297|nr:fimbrial protein [Burkholderia latens]
MNTLLRVLLLSIFAAAPLAHATTVPTPLPTTLSVLRHGPVGALLGSGWVYSSEASLTAPDGTNQVTGISSVYGAELAGVHVNGPGELTYPVFKSKMGSAAGVGFALGARMSHNGGPWVWAAIGSNFANIKPFMGPAKPGDTVRVQFYVALVRLGDIQPGRQAILSGSSVVFYNGNNPLVGIGEKNMTTNINVVNQTCKVDQVPPVKLGSWPTTTFTGMGTGSTPKKFSVSMTCPADFTHVYYQLNPAGGSAVVDQTPGTISLNQGMASGVSVQIKDDTTGAPVQFGKNVLVNQYNPEKDQQPIQLDFEARYIQTGDRVAGGGEAAAQALLTISYD